MEVIRFSDFRNNLKKSLDKVNDDHEFVVISQSNKKNVVLISLEDFNSLNTSSHLLSTKTNRERIEHALEEMQTGKFLSKELLD